MTDPRERGRGQGQFAIIPLPDGISPGPAIREVSVADELAFDALPEEIKRIAERVVVLRVFSGSKYSSYEEAYDDGRERGEEIGAKEAREEMKDPLAQLQKRVDTLVRELQASERELVRAESERDELKAAIDLQRKAKSA